MNGLDQIGVTPMNEVMIHGIDENLSKAFKRGFQVANKDIKRAFICSLYLALMYRMLRKSSNVIAIESFDHLSHSDAFTSAIVDKLNRHPAMVQT